MVSAFYMILHSQAADVVLSADSEEPVANSGMPPEKLVDVGKDHPLASRPRVLGGDFGVPKRAGDQAKKIIIVEAIRLGQRHYAIERTGRNFRRATLNRNQKRDSNV